jgi:hypothetical protein
MQQPASRRGMLTAICRIICANLRDLRFPLHSTFAKEGCETDSGALPSGTHQRTHTFWRASVPESQARARFLPNAKCPSGSCPSGSDPKSQMPRLSVDAGLRL